MLGSQISRRTLFAMCAAASTACHLDPLGNSERTIAAPYRLMRWEDGATFYLVDDGGGSGGGVAGGVVRRIGWSRGLIVVDRQATFRGDGDGLVVIDAAERSVRGPIPAEELEADKRLSGITLLSAVEAWERLGH